MKRTFFACILAALLLALLPALAQPADAAGLTTQSKVNLTFTEPNTGMSIDDFNANVRDANLESVTIYNAFTEEEVTEGKFETNKVYLINFVITPNEGSRFHTSTVLNYNRSFIYITPDSEGKLHYQHIYTDRVKSTSATYLKLPLLREGMNTNDLEFTYQDNGKCKVESFKVIDLQDGSEVTTLQKNKNYRLQMTFLPIEGYLLSQQFSVYLNDAPITTTRLKAGTYGEGYIDFSLDFPEIVLTKLPGEPGGASWPSAASLRSSHPCVKVQAYPSWVDSEKKSCKGNPVGGEVYYLSVKLIINGPVGLTEVPPVTADGREVSVTVINETSARVYIRYVADYTIDKVELTTHGIEEGKPLSDVYADVVGNAHISQIEIVEDSIILSNIEGKVFEGGKQYRVSFFIAPNSGYCSGPNSILVFNGTEFSLSNGSKIFTQSLDTRYIIDSAKIDISGVGVGKTISKVTVKSDNQALYPAYVDSWASTNTTSTKFAKGHIYQLHFRLEIQNYDYRFTKNATITVGGKEAFNLMLSYNERVVEGIVEFSFLNEVTKVTLPAMPKSIQQGQTLPTNFKVSSSAKYTLQAVWVALSTQSEATTASQKDSYILTYVVIPKKGYEFTEDTVFYVDGKKVTPMLAYSDGAEIMKAYNVGLTEIDRIDLTVAEPEKDAVPGIVTVADNAPYAPATMGWGVNTSGKLDDSVKTATVFENYKYHYLGVEFVAADGYAFADKVTVYINGSKFTVLEDYAFGPAYQMTVSFGKLGDIPKLTAPELSTSGATLSWDVIRNADSYEIYRATSKSGKYTKVGTVAETTWTDSPEKGKTYYYKVKAIFTPDTTKNSSYSAVVSIVYKCDTPVISVENAASGKPVISWNKVSGAKQYTVYVATAQNGTYKKLGTSKTLSYTDSKAKSGNTYFYKVIANGSKSTYDSGYSNIVSCGVICGTPSVSVKVDANTGKPTLSWKKVDAATGYVIYRDGEFLTTVTAVTYADTTAAIDTQYSYAVQALGKTEDLNGSLSKAVSATSGIAKPAAKGSVDTVSGKPVITWQAVEGAVKYEIYRSTKSSKSYKLVATVEELTYTDETVSAGKTYYYKVKAIGAVSKSADSSYVKLTGKCATPQISVSKDAKGKPYITWEKISGAKKYTVYRATSETGKYSKLGTTTKTYYTDSKATAGKNYFYKIVANASSSKNNSPYSNIVTCGVNCAAPVAKVSNNAAGQVVISWAKISGAKQYKVLYMDVTDYTDDVDPHEDFKKYHKTAITTQTSFTLPDMDVGRYYMVSVVAIADNEELSSQPDKEIFAVIIPATPKITGKVGENMKPVISWAEVEGATKYVVYRSTSKSKGYKVIGEADGLTYEDLTAKKGKTYYYKVVAVGEGFQSAQSGYVKIKSK